MKVHRTKTSIVTLIVVAILACGAIFLSLTTQNNTTAINANNIETATCVRVVDGDTLVVNLNNQEQKVRLVGVDTPESVSSDSSKNCEEGKIASDYTKSLVKEGQTLYLSKDTSDTDKYGRLLRFVWLEQPTENPTQDEIKTKMLNAILVKDGYAQAKDYKPDVSLSSLFHKLGTQAESDNLGVTYKWKS